MSDIVEELSGKDCDPEKVTRAQIIEYIMTKQMDPNTYVVWNEGNHIIN